MQMKKTEMHKDRVAGSRGPQEMQVESCRGQCDGPDCLPIA